MSLSQTCSPILMCRRRCGYLAQVIVIHDDTHRLTNNAKGKPENCVAHERVSKHAINGLRDKNHRRLGKHSKESIHVHVLKRERDNNFVHQGREQEHDKCRCHFGSPRANQGMVYNRINERIRQSHICYHQQVLHKCRAIQ